MNFGGKLPLTYYNLINEEISRREDNKDREYGSTPGRDGHKVTFLSCDWSDDHYHDAFISFIQDVTHVQSMTPGHNQDVPNPNAINRPLAWPIRVKSSISMDMQVNICVFDVFNFCSTFFQDDIIDIIISSLEKFHWENTEIAYWIKVNLKVIYF